MNVEIPRSQSPSANDRDPPDNNSNASIAVQKFESAPQSRRVSMSPQPSSDSYDSSD